MINDNKTEKENRLNGKKRTIYDVMESTARSTPSKVLSISLLIIAIISVFEIYILNNLPEMDYVDNADSLINAVLYAGIVQFLIFIAYEIIVILAGKKKIATNGIVILEGGLVIDAIITIFEEFEVKSAPLDTIISIGIACIFPILTLSCLSNIKEFYNNDTFRPLPSVLQNVCYVFGALQTLVAVLNFTTAFTHILLTILFLIYVVSAIINFSVAGVINKFNHYQMVYEVENSTMAKTIDGFVNNHISSSRCPKCNTKNLEDAKKCSSCGAPLGQ